MNDTALAYSMSRLESLSKEVPAVLHDCRAWAALYPFMDFSQDLEDHKLMIRIRVVDVPIIELEARNDDLDGDESFIHDRINKIVQTPEQVASILAQVGISIDGFVSSYQSGLPF